jgi:pimeloyl-ACP methyl ester carboxylesterase
MTEHTLHTADGVRLAAHWWPPQSTGDGRAAGPSGDDWDDRVAVVVVHGFCGSKDEPAVQLVALSQAAAGRPVLTFDLRGHGASGGATTLGMLERLDVDAAVRAARSEAGAVVVVGASMGGVATIDHLAAEASATGDEIADGAVLVGTPARWQIPRSARGVLALVLTRTPPGRAVAARRMGTRVAVRPGRGLEPRVRISAVRRPVAVVHGLADRFVPPLAAHLLHAATAEPRRLDLVPGMGHGFCAEAVGPVDAAVGWLTARWTAAPTLALPEEEPA